MPWVHPSLGAGAGICWGFGVSRVLRERACAGGGGGPLEVSSLGLLVKGSGRRVCLSPSAPQAMHPMPHSIVPQDEDNDKKVSNLQPYKP